MIRHHDPGLRIIFPAEQIRPNFVDDFSRIAEDHGLAGDVAEQADSAVRADCHEIQTFRRIIVPGQPKVASPGKRGVHAGNIAEIPVDDRERGVRERPLPVSS